MFRLQCRQRLLRYPYFPTTMIYSSPDAARPHHSIIARAARRLQPASQFHSRHGAHSSAKQWPLAVNISRHSSNPVSSWPGEPETVRLHTGRQLVGYATQLPLSTYYNILLSSPHRLFFDFFFRSSVVTSLECQWLAIYCYFGYANRYLIITLKYNCKANEIQSASDSFSFSPLSRLIGSSKQRSHHQHTISSSGAVLN